MVGEILKGALTTLQCMKAKGCHRYLKFREHLSKFIDVYILCR